MLNKRAAEALLAAIDSPDLAAVLTRTIGGLLADGAGERPITYEDAVTRAGARHNWSTDVLARLRERDVEAMERLTVALAELREIPSDFG